MAGSYEISLLQANGMANVKAYTFADGRMLETGGGDYPAQQVEIRASELASWMGTPVFNEVRLESQDRSISITLETVLVEINQSKNIVRTQVAGREGTVKEYISKGDYFIVLKGGIFSTDPQDYPTDDVTTLIQLLDSEEALLISSDFLQLFGVYNYVVSSYNMPQRIGHQSNQLYEIRGYSDIPIELLIDEEA